MLGLACSARFDSQAKTARSTPPCGVDESHSYLWFPECFSILYLYTSRNTRRLQEREAFCYSIMDPVSITFGVVGLVAAITQLSNYIIKLKARSSKTDLEGLEQESLSLKSSLAALEGGRTDISIAGDFNGLNITIKKMTGNSLIVVQEFVDLLNKHKRKGPCRAFLWTISGRTEVENLKKRLIAHISALKVALAVVQLWVKKFQNTDTIRMLITMAGCWYKKSVRTLDMFLIVWVSYKETLHRFSKRCLYSLRSYLHN
jgi:hypothetical protein